MDFDWTPEQDELRAKAREVAADAVARFGRQNDSWINGYSDEFAKEMAALGWIGLTWPTEFGGGGRPPIERLIIAEELISAGAPIAAMWFADRQMGPTLIAYGRPDQQAEFLPGILAGESTWCIGMSEPEAGSDLASLRTSARRDGDDWVINGQKIWTSFAAVADYCYCICRTSTDGPAARRDQRDHRADGHAGHRGPADHRHDDEPPLLRGLLHRRAGARRSTWSASRATRSSRPWASSSTSGAGSTGSCRTTPSTAWRWSGSTTAIRWCARRSPRSRPGTGSGASSSTREVLKQAPAGFSAATKCFCTEHEQRVAEFVARAFGAEATLWSDVTHGLVYAPGYTIMGGTSNIMRNILGERVLGLPREPR